jgi:hypothetical protein
LQQKNKFSKVSAIVYLLYKVTIASAVENVYLAAALALGAGLDVYRMVVALILLMPTQLRVLVLLRLALIHCVLLLLLLFLLLLAILRLRGMAHTDAVVDALECV